MIFHGIGTLLEGSFSSKRDTVSSSGVHPASPMTLSHRWIRSCGGFSPSMTQLDFESLRRRVNCAGPPQRPGHGAWLGTPARPSGSGPMGLDVVQEDR